MGRHLEEEPKTITVKGPGGIVKHSPLVTGTPKENDSGLTDKERIQAIIDLIDITPPMTDKRHPRRGMRQH